MKKSLLVAMPLFAVSFLASCGGGKSPTPETIKVNWATKYGVCINTQHGEGAFDCEKNKEFTANLSIQDDDPKFREVFILPEDLLIQSNNNVLVAGTDYTYQRSDDKKTATLKITKTSNDISIYAEGYRAATTYFIQIPREGLNYSIYCNSASDIKINWGDGTDIETIPTDHGGQKINHQFKADTSTQEPTVTRRIDIYGDLLYFYFQGLDEHVNMIYVGSSITNFSSTFKFSNAAHLISVDCGYNVLTIDENTFKDCRTLSSFSFADYTCLIGNRAFDGCDDLSHVSFSKDVVVPPAIGENVFGNRIRDDFEIQVPNELVDMFKHKPDWRPYANYIKGYNS